MTTLRGTADFSSKAVNSDTRWAIAHGAFALQLLAATAISIYIAANTEPLFIIPIVLVAAGLGLASVKMWQNRPSHWL